MASNANVFMTNWQWTGITVPTPQASVDVTVEWIDDAGIPHSHNEIVKFPNILADVPVPWLKTNLENWILAMVRKKLNLGPDIP